MEIVKMEHVTKIYGEGDTRVWGLDDVNLTIDKGEIVAIVGRQVQANRQCCMSWAVWTHLTAET